MSDSSTTSLNLKNPALFRDKAYIDGQWVGADSGKVFPVTNPADGSRIAEVPNQDVDETRRAIEAANAAWPGWRSRTAKDRAAILRRWYNLMIENKDDLAKIMTAEQGKPLAESVGEIMYGASFVEWFAEEGKRVYGDMIPTHMPDRHHAVEFPERDDHPQSRPRPGGRLPDRDQTRTGNPLVCTGPGGTG
jgi:succinate-semialdehyde dehydrogenase/glutarate-semialdehyde dehydrogenase